MTMDDQTVDQVPAADSILYCGFEELLRHFRIVFECHRVNTVAEIEVTHRADKRGAGALLASGQASLPLRQ